MRRSLIRFTVNWVTFWEGVVLYALGGIWWALGFFIAWTLVAIGFHLSKWKRLSS